MSTVPVILKRLRAERAVTQDQVAEAVKVSKSLIAAFETSRLAPKADTAERLDEYFDTGKEIQKAAFEARKHVRQAPQWFRPWREVEDTATSLRYFQLSLVPGLLQTEAYARSVLDSGLRSPQEVDEEVARRLARQVAVFDRPDPPVCSFVLDVAALRCGDPELTGAQLRHLADLGARPGVYLCVVPETVGMYPGRSGAFALGTLDDGRMVGYLEDFFEGRVHAEPDRVTALDRMWHAVSAVALPCDQSRDLILRMVKDL
ncbi:helix-turn-helix transcriptional regulator [Micromonospora sp. WMMD1102]|uniref:helix-turn-helix domain-containing protein n=1 Tax=Micromonospora sp. WMMD1102 TaxID=3016105 RepID=UPI0024156670|nr:helix-turn-helix transcriptional regulator [Micromonospora sp. WMMD1102]MDG4786761.1 helix-turn-helix transcriptional regulator [Micromonospora sp. WMMD1102]